MSQSKIKANTRDYTWSKSQLVLVFTSGFTSDTFLTTQRAKYVKPKKTHYFRCSFQKCSNGSLFSPSCLFALTTTTEELITEFLFADNGALLVHKDVALQLIVVNCFSKATKAFGLVISLKEDGSTVPITSLEKPTACSR